MLSVLFNILCLFGVPQEPCPSLTAAELVESADLVAVVTLDEEVTDYFEGTDIGALRAKRVFKGSVTGDIWNRGLFFISNTDHVIEKNTEYLIFAEYIIDDKSDIRFSLGKCAKVVKLGEASPDVIDYLEERWISKCYSKELEDKMKGKHTRGYEPFCGCDGKTYNTFADLQGSGITQYYLRECKD